MKRFSTVTSVLAQIKFLEEKVENYFNSRRQKNEVSRENFSKDFENIALRSLHTMGQGSVRVALASDRGKIVRYMDIPTTTYFLVTGIRTIGEEYRLTFAASMS